VKRRRLGDTGLEIPPLIFGCAPMMGRVGRRASLRALAHAYDRGLTCFDVARSYGYGEAEGLLGEFLRGRRDRVVVATKFGIAARRQSLMVRRLVKPAARYVLSALPQAGRRARQALGSQFVRPELSPQALERSLDESLRELQTDYVDILFLHDPPVGALHDEALLAAVKAMVRSGKVRVCGVAGSPLVAREARDAAADLLRVLQIPYGPFDRRAERWLGDASNPATPALIAHQPFGGAAGAAKLRATFRALTDDDALALDLRRRMREDPDRMISDLALGMALAGGAIQAVVCSMFQPRHIDRNIAAVESPVLDGPEIAQILDRLGAREDVLCV
jgi:aryl-alcohol dehydrogenase-like predicted oxidoreductase